MKRDNFSITVIEREVLFGSTCVEEDLRVGGVEEMSVHPGLVFARGSAHVHASHD